MQSTAFTHSVSKSLTPKHRTFGSTSDHIRLSASIKIGDRDRDLSAAVSASSPPRRSWTLSPSSTPGLRPWSGVNYFTSGSQLDRVEATAASVSGDGEDSGSLSATLELAVLFVFWFLFNIYFNIYNKQVLKVFHYPANITLIQFAVGSLLVMFMWTFNLHKRPNLTRSQLMTILPLAIVHTLGNLFTNMSLGKVSVSFTHTIKAMEPFFSVILSAMFLGDMPTPWIVASLFPVVGGVALASATEASFNWVGFWSAMASNLTNQSRNVLSKKLMVKNKEDSMDNITLFSVITVMSFFLTLPVLFFTEGFKFSASHLNAVAGSGVDIQQLLTRTFFATLCFHAYQQVSYMILQRVSPVTHSVGNCVKRVVVIVSSVLVFHTPVSAINSIGTAIALAGVFLYSRVKSIKPKQKAT